MDKKRILFFVLPLLLAAVLYFPHKVLAANGYYDLYVESLTTDPDQCAAGHTCTLTIKVKNNGSTALTSTVGILNYAYEISDFTLTSITVTPISVSSPIEPGDYITYTLVGVFESIGSKSVSFQVDISNQLSETNENNNSLPDNTTVNVVAWYDLQFDSITVTPSEPAVNQQCEITVKVKNNGVASLYSYSGITDVEYQFPDFYKTAQTFPVVSTTHRFNSGQYISYVFRGYFTSSGEKTLTFSLDTADQLDEGNEDNNSGEKTITVVAPDSYDLQVKSIVFSPAEPLVNESTTVTVTIINNSDASLTASTGFGADDIKITYTNFSLTNTTYPTWPSLTNPFAPGQELTYVFSGKFVGAGEKKFTFQLDKNNELTESNEDNNYLEATTTVFLTASARDDFEITKVKVMPLASTSVRISWQTTRPTTGLISYEKKYGGAAAKTANASDSATSHSITLTGLNAGTAYNYYVKASYGTVTKYSNQAEFSTPANDNFFITVGPSVSVDSVASSATISWQTNLGASGYVYYRVKDADEFQAVGSDDLAQEHSITLNNLADGAYEFYCLSTSNFGAQTTSQTKEFSIQTSGGQSQSNANTQTQPNAQQSSQSSNTQVETIKNQSLYNNLKGKIILRVQANGEAYYLSPQTAKRYYLGRPSDAFAVMRELGIGITNADLAKIPIGLTALSGIDTDQDGLSDLFEEAIGTNSALADTDSDGYNDKAELETGYSPFAAGQKLNFDNQFAQTQAGKIFLQVESHGEAWYVNPVDNKRYFLGRPADAFSVMRELGLGISEADFSSL